TGILSFAHTMFFGIGAYGIAIGSETWGNEYGLWTAVGLGLLAALALSIVLALVISLFSLRVKTLYFAMITLAVAAAFQILCSQLGEFTGGSDGINFMVPEALQPQTELGWIFLGQDLTGSHVAFYSLLAVVAVLFLVLLRVVNSPFGRVLQAIRDNDFRAEALGYRAVVFRSTSSVLGALFACLAGALYALWLRYNGPAVTLGFDIMINILIMSVIGGLATMYGAVIGATIYTIAQNYLQDLLRHADNAVEGIPIIQGIMHPDRWPLWMGILFILCVYYFPFGIVGKLRMGAALRRAKKA
ncbi:MAG TPA: branched-chain amino acid ABC transporter permease, partial [Rhodocyclaceae bacterium]|nr:branched-chain amino acid ABC transporter permease [Rhodocyclaceae bacterium]